MTATPPNHINCRCTMGVMMSTTPVIMPRAWKFRNAETLAAVSDLVDEALDAMPCNITYRKGESYRELYLRVMEYIEHPQSRLKKHKDCLEELAEVLLIAADREKQIKKCEVKND